jgi:hypothetical protein
LDVRIDRILEEVEEGLEAGVAVALGGWYLGCGKACQKGEDIVGGYGTDLPVAERLLEPGKNELIVFERIFFEFIRWYSRNDWIP